MSAAGVRGPPADGLDGGDAGQAVLLGARDDADGRAGPRQLDGDGPAQARARPGDDGRRAGEGVGGQEGRPRRRRLGQSHGGYFPSNSACCFLAFAA